MKPYYAVFSARVRVLMQYRAAALAGIGCQIFFGFVRMMIFDAFYRSGAGPQPMTHSEVIAYIWLGQAFLLLALVRIDGDVAEMIRSGNVVYEMVKPLDLYHYWHTRAVSLSLAPILMRGIPILLFVVVVFDFPMPFSASALGLFILSLALAMLLSSAISVLISISMLWTIAGNGAAMLFPAIIFILSGIVIPLPLFPDWAQPIINALPFRGLIDVPFRIYLGHMGTAEAVVSMAQQLAYIAGFIWLGRMVLARGMRRLVVQGG